VSQSIDYTEINTHTVRASQLHDMIYTNKISLQELAEIFKCICTPWHACQHVRMKALSQSVKSTFDTFAFSKRTEHIENDWKFPIICELLFSRENN